MINNKTIKKKQIILLILYFIADTFCTNQQDQPNQIIYITEYNSNNKIVINSNLGVKKYYSNNEKVKFIFNVFDNLPKDEYLDYNEIFIFQKLTDPQLPLNWQDYKLVCQILGSNYRFGITINEYNSSYYLYQDQLGTNLEKDFNIIYNLINKNII